MQIPNIIDAKRRSDKEVQVISDAFNMPDSMKHIGDNKTYYIETYGCQMNVHDSENISAILEQMGYTKNTVMEEADFILLNTCSIRENAHNKVFGRLGRIKHLKETRPNVISGLCGCMAQEEHVVEKLLNKFKWLDIVFGTHNIHNLPNILDEALRKKELEIEVFSKEGNIYENIPVKRDNKYKAWVNIMYGCDKFCTYCIVPYTRGKQRSRTKEDIINEVNQLIKDGYKEITLLGQNVNAYGKDFINNNYNMENLLKDVSDTGIERVSFVTSHPWDFTAGMIKVIKENKNIMPCIHLPIQSGSNKILKLMGRRYTKEEYSILFNKIKKAIPDVIISTDIIVGFPGETDEDFNDTINIVNELKFDFAFTFIYSPRVGTPAALLENKLTKEEKNNRLYQLNELVNKYALESNETYINKIVDVLVEGHSNKGNNILIGYSNTNKLINFKGNDDSIGKIIKVKITNVKTWSLDGEMINE